MAKFIVSSVLLGTLAAFFALSLVSLYIEAKPAEEIDLGPGAEYLDDLFNPIAKQILRSTAAFTSDLTALLQSGLSPQLSEQLRHLVESLETSAQDNFGFPEGIHLGHAILITAIILWPFALLVLCVGCCILCNAYCILSIALLAIVATIFLAGLIFYSGPLAGNFGVFSNGDNDVTQVVANLLQTLSSVSNEALNAAVELFQKGSLSQATPILYSLQHAVNVYSGLGQELKQFLTNPKMTEALAQSVVAGIGQVQAGLSSLSAQIDQLMVDGVSNGGERFMATNDALKQLVEQIQAALFKLEDN